MIKLNLSKICYFGTREIKHSVHLIFSRYIYTHALISKHRSAF